MINKATQRACHAFQMHLPPAKNNRQAGNAANALKAAFSCKWRRPRARRAANPIQSRKPQGGNEQKTKPTKRPSQAS